MTDDAIPERAAREEQEELDRAHGQQILDILKGDTGPQPADAFLQAIARAHEAELRRHKDNQ